MDGTGNDPAPDADRTPAAARPYGLGLHLDFPDCHNFRCLCRPHPYGHSGTDTHSPVLVAELGGDTTAFTTTRNAFGLSARNLDTPEQRTFAVGSSFFQQNWVTAPASTEARDGLGPTFNALSCNALSCSSCQFLDGRGKPPDGPDDGERGLLLRLSIPSAGPHGGPLLEPVYGGQLQDRAIVGVPMEGKFVIIYEEAPGVFGDWKPYSLRRPTYQIRDLGFGPMHPQTLVSPRVAPPVA